MSKVKKPKMALWVSGIYLLLALGAWVLPLIAKPEESLAGVFLVLFAQPWASLWIWITDTLQIDILTLTMAAMLGGILLNTWLIYWLIYWIFSWRSRRQ